MESIFCGPFGRTEAFHPKKSCRSFGLRKREKKVGERKVVVWGRVLGNLLSSNIWGDANTAVPIPKIVRLPATSIASMYHGFRERNAVEQELRLWIAPEST